jgi:bifunctional UDP-N-acetylglucosamine pyrophosphorylase/glucosamine-1-phosphate N-acetyltransferase
MSNQVISVVLAAGASTRMKSSTSKLLQSVLGRTIIQLALEQASAITDSLVVVLGHQREEVETEIKKCASSKLKIKFALQEKLIGTADAVKAALKSLEGADPQSDIFIMGADSGLLKKESLLSFKKEHETSKAVLSLLTAAAPLPNSYGRILRNSQGTIEAIIEAKDASPEQLMITEFNTGFYLVKLFALREALTSVSNKNQSKEFYLTDIVSYGRKQGWVIQAECIALEEAAGINTQADLAEFSEILQRRINNSWMEKGVRLLDPKSTFIDFDVQLAADTVIEAGVHLRGKTRLASGVHIGAHAILSNVEVGANTKIEGLSHLVDCKIGKDSSVGPFARIRGGAVLENDVHIGNFVEIKKSHLKSGVKSGHLAYLGDAEIGSDTNIGAGTITCNYDGFKKHGTKIGENVFIGSNSSLVAPVEIGKDAIIGAGSVITKNVAAGSLAVERAEQRELKDGAKKFRAKRSKS